MDSNDFSFLKTGFGNIDPSTQQVDFLRKVFSIMKILYEESFITAARLCEICGETTVTKQHIMFAMKFEAHEFFEKDFEEKYLRYYQEEQQHTYETEDEESQDESEEDNSEEDESEEEEDESEEEEKEFEEGEGKSDDCKDEIDEHEGELQFVKGTEEDQHFFDKVLSYNRDWNAWRPDDPVKALLKRAIDHAD